MRYFIALILLTPSLIYSQAQLVIDTYYGADEINGETLTVLSNDMLIYSGRDSIHQAEPWITQAVSSRCAFHLG
jgi:hypothetical protein